MARQGLFEWSSVRLGLAKWGLIVFNVASWCLGVVSLAVGLWLYVTANEYATFSAGEHLLGSVLLVSVGVAAVLVGFMGVVAALWESTLMASFYAVMVGLACAGFLACGVWSLVQGQAAPLMGRLEAHLERTARAYEINSAYSHTWDAMQSRFECCGVEGAEQWAGFLRLRSSTPPSCCREEPCSEPFSQGCLQPLLDYEKRQFDMMGPIGVAFGVFQVLGIALSVYFCMTVRGSKKQ